MYKGKRQATVVTVFEAIGAYRAGKITLDELYEVEQVACPGAGACGGQYTANTMSTVCEFLGISPAGLNGIPAEDPAKDEAARRTGELVMDLVRDDVRPGRVHHARSRSRTRSPPSRRPAVAPTASSTSSRSPTSTASRSTSTSSAPSPTGRRSWRTCVPGGRYTAADMHEAGGVALVMRELLKRGLLHGDLPTVDGRTIARIAQDAAATEGQQVVVPIETPIKPVGGLAILRGSLAPGRMRRQAGAATSAATTAGRPASSTPRPRASTRCGRGGSSRATSSSSATRARWAGPGCRRC